MTITHAEAQKKNSSRMSVFIDGKYAFGIDEEDWFRLDLHVGKEVTQQDIERINETCNYSKAKKAAVKYSVYKRRTAFEMIKKLEQQGFDDFVIERVIGQLQQLGYIDDREYACRFIKDARNLKKFGEHRIYLELQRKGIDEKTIYDELNKAQLDDREVLEPLIRKKIASVSCGDDNALIKIKNYFLRKGYSFEMINKVIHDIIHESNY
ncbi:RecX family transcriptional regulator [Petroclostridium sp. X23]|uniref:RecX family transcriptional regulator n=1 Tax=Petroclostridium sp. X23 TaxID=3045146 RepID=UPI0024AE7C8F|nr:RecX family transcriptional regulator [Petroclostridium sp. X23]WHH59401.1 RecX family transcriptional regulator [Petroclostridium sp. X23]